MYRTRDPLSALAEYVCPRCRFPVHVPTGEVPRWSTCPRDGWPLVSRDAFLRSDGDPLLGLELDGGFVPIELAGSGATSSVYKARRADGGLAAIKVLRIDTPIGAHASDAWQREVAALEGFDGPGIVRMLDTGRIVQPPAFFIALDWVDGAPLVALPVDRSIPRAVGIAIAVCRALTELHARGFVHGDLKPSDVLATFDDSADGAATAEARKVIGSLTVVDLGSSSIEGRKRAPFDASDWIGSPAYASPEQLDGGAVDRRADLYAVGCLLHWLLTGRPPFEGTVDAIASAHRVRPAPLPSVRNADVGSELDALVATLMEKDRGRRPGCAAAVVALLGRVSTDVKGAA